MAAVPRVPHHLTQDQVARLRQVLLDALSAVGPQGRGALLAAAADLPLHPDDWRGTDGLAVGDDTQDGLDEVVEVVEVADVPGQNGPDVLVERRPDQG